MKHSSRNPLAAKALACALIAAMASAPVASASSVSKTQMEWRTDLPAALAEAAKHNRAVLLRFTATWCAPCRVMDARVWTNPDVKAAVADKFITVKSDIDEEPSQILARKYGVRGVPALLHLDGTGKEIARSGFMSSPETVKFLKSPAAPASLP